MESNRACSQAPEPIPTDLATAIGLAKESSLMKDVYGEDLLTLNIMQAERELEFFANQVTSVETERYLGNF